MGLTNERRRLSLAESIYPEWSVIKDMETLRHKLVLKLQWRHNDRDDVSNHRRLEGLLNRLFTRRSKKASKLRQTALCKGNSTVTGEFLSQRASNAENVSIDENSFEAIRWQLEPERTLDRRPWLIISEKES